MDKQHASTPVVGKNDTYAISRLALTITAPSVCEVATVRVYIHAKSAVVTNSSLDAFTLTNHLRWNAGTVYSQTLATSGRRLNNDGRKVVCGPDTTCRHVPITSCTPPSVCNIAFVLPVMP